MTIFSSKISNYRKVPKWKNDVEIDLCRFEFFHLRIHRGFTLVNFSAFAKLSRTDRSRDLRSVHVTQITWLLSRDFSYLILSVELYIEPSRIQKKRWTLYRRNDEQERFDVLLEKTNNFWKQVERNDSFNIKNC